MLRSFRLVISVAAISIVLSSVFFSVGAADRKTIRIFVDGDERAISTDADTVGEALKLANINTEKSDLVEPTPETKIEQSGFNINIFRARPVLVEDKGEQHKVYTAQQSPSLIAKDAKIKTYDEDEYNTEVVTDFIGDEYIGQKITIDRSILVSIMFDGEQVDLRTQAETVGELLGDEGVIVRDDDQLNHQLSDSVKEDMKIIVVRVGHRLKTVEEKIDYETEIVYDTTKPVDWSEIERKGKDGARIVSYEINKETGKKTALQTVVKSKPITKIIKWGNKQPEVSSGANSGAFAQLRQCESGGNYANKNNPSYRGAYQFSYATWSAMGGSGDPAEAPPAEQDYRARLLQQQSGWGQWPACSAKLNL